MKDSPRAYYQFDPHWGWEKEYLSAGFLSFVCVHTHAHMYVHLTLHVCVHACTCEYFNGGLSYINSYRCDFCL
jgi:hypothetical protein